MITKRLLGLALILSAGFAYAADSCPAPTKTTRIDADYVIDRAVSGCLGGINDQTPVSKSWREGAALKRLAELAARSDKSEELALDEVPALVMVQAQKLEEYLKDTPVPKVDTASAEATSLAAYRLQMIETLALLRGNARTMLSLKGRPKPTINAGTGQPKTVEWKVNDISFDALRNPNTYGPGNSSSEKIQVQFSAIKHTWTNMSFINGTGKGPLLKPCAGSSVDACNAAGQYVSELLRVVRLTQDLVQQSFVKISISAVGVEARRINTSWDSYFNDARSQTFFELYVNSRLWKGRSSTAGFASPPTGQLIFLHPGLAMEYVGGAEDGDQFKPAALLEGVGYNWFGYDDDGKLSTAYGFSLGAIFADRAKVPDVRPAAIFIYDNIYSIGVTYGGGNVGVLLSGDLLALGKGVKKKFQDQFKAGVGIGSD